MKKYQLLFKISAVLSYLFFVFGLSQLTLIVQNYWQFSSQIGNFLPRLAIFFPDWQFRLDSKSLEFAI